MSEEQNFPVTSRIFYALNNNPGFESIVFGFHLGFYSAQKFLFVIGIIKS
jgi:hypothetical protein